MHQQRSRQSLRLKQAKKAPLSSHRKIHTKSLKRKHNPNKLTLSRRLQHTTSSSESQDTEVIVENSPYHTQTDVFGENRSHYINDLNNLPDGTPITITGWVERVRALGKVSFIVIRDTTGCVQATLQKSELDAHEQYFTKKNDEILSKDKNSQNIVDLTTIGSAAYKTIEGLRPESVVSLKGFVFSRPKHQIKQDQALGTKEIFIRSLRQLNTSLPLPISLYDTQDQTLNEDILLKYRFLDLRRNFNQNIMKLRSRLTMAARQSMYLLGFNEIETPYLVKSTPEGAREYLVPTRSPGKFFALPQSPQQHKQLLMCSGFDKYFQIARCFRDESGRQDRQPEFTQLDMELSFASPQLVMKSVETMINNMYMTTYGEQMPELRRIRYLDVMNKFGSDKPDIRYRCELNDITDIFTTQFFHEKNKYITNEQIIDILQKDTTGDVSHVYKKLSSNDVNDPIISTLLNIFPQFLTAQHELDTNGTYGKFIKQSTNDTTSSSAASSTATDSIVLSVEKQQNDGTIIKTTKPLARHPFPCVKMVIARDLNAFLSKGKNKSIMSHLLRDCEEGSNGLRPTIIACNKWDKIKTDNVLLTEENVQKKLQEKFNLQSNDMLFILAGEWEHVCNGLGKIRQHLKPLFPETSPELQAPDLSDAPINVLPQENTVERQTNPHIRYDNDYVIAENWKKQNSDLLNKHINPSDALNPTAPRPVFHWVVDFPLFELEIPKEVFHRSSSHSNSDDNTDTTSLPHTTIHAMHHPFTSPHPEDINEFQQLINNYQTKVDKIGTDDAIYHNDQYTGYPLDINQLTQSLAHIRALHYDLVCNGLEVGGGSIRIHNADVQRNIFDILQVPHHKFQHLLTALEFGAPPHGGFAAGLDRLIAIFGSQTPQPLKLKDVIAFPKNTAGNDLLLGSPNLQTQSQLDEYFIDVVKEPQQNASTVDKA